MKTPTKQLILGAGLLNLNCLDSHLTFQAKLKKYIGKWHLID